MLLLRRRARETAFFRRFFLFLPPASVVDATVGATASPKTLERSAVSVADGDDLRRVKIVDRAFCVDNRLEDDDPLRCCGCSMLFRFEALVSLEDDGSMAATNPSRESPFGDARNTYRMVPSTCPRDESDELVSNCGCYLELCVAPLDHRCHTECGVYSKRVGTTVCRTYGMTTINSSGVLERFHSGKLVHYEV